MSRATFEKLFFLFADTSHMRYSNQLLISWGLLNICFSFYGFLHELLQIQLKHFHESTSCDWAFKSASTVYRATQLMGQFAFIHWRNLSSIFHLFLPCLLMATNPNLLGLLLDQYLIRQTTRMEERILFRVKLLKWF